MGRFLQERNFGCFMSLKKHCWPAEAKPDLLPHFLLFCGENDLLKTILQPQPLINSLQCTAMHSKCTQNALFCVTFNRAFLEHFQCILVHCSELMGYWGWGSVIRRSGSAQNNKKKLQSKSGLATTGQQSFFSSSDTKQAKFPSLGNLPIWTMFI